MTIMSCFIFVFSPYNAHVIRKFYCVKSVRIRSFLVRTKAKAGKYGPEKLQIRTLFTQCLFQTALINSFQFTVAFLYLLDISEKLVVF